MLLSDFEKSMDPVVVRQGKEYLRAGRVGEVEQVPGGAFVATVRGRAPYEVFAELDETGRVADTGCSCPFRFGPHCKHVAALLYRLREELLDAEMGLPLMRAVSRMGREQLLSLLVRTARQDRAFAEALILNIQAVADRRPR